MKDNVYGSTLMLSMLEDLKCCGNCNHYQQDNHCTDLHYNVCTQWEWDKMTADDRIIKESAE